VIGRNIYVSESVTLMPESLILNNQSLNMNQMNTTTSRKIKQCCTQTTKSQRKNVDLYENNLFSLREREREREVISNKKLT